MKISNKRKLQQIAYNHLSDIDFKDLMILLENVLQNHILFKLLHQIILHVPEIIFWKEYKN